MTARAAVINFKRQRGFVLMAAALLLGVALAAILLGNLSARQTELANEARTPEALNEAKQALLGYILLDDRAPGTGKLKPGSLPCPDKDADNDSDFYDNMGANCSATGTILFHYPGKNFRTGELRDAANEKLWYALSPAFRTTAAAPLNLVTAAQLTVDGQGEYVAVIISPGQTLPEQTRGTSATRENFLEDSNADGDMHFISKSVRPFNDRIIGITRKEWEAAVSPIVANEILNRLIKFQQANSGYFPWATPWTATPTRSMSMQAGIPQGMLPVADLWPAPPTPSDPPTAESNEQQRSDWLPQNEWYRFVYYAVAPAMLPGASRDCAIDGCLTVSRNGVAINNVKALFMLSGSKIGSQNRPSADLTDYFEDADNRDGNTMFVMNAVTPTSNDRLYILK